MNPQQAVGHPGIFEEEEAEVGGTIEKGGRCGDLPTTRNVVEVIGKYPQPPTAGGVASLYSLDEKL
jgi:hypothetical protein